MSHTERQDISMSDVYKLAQDVAEQFDTLAQHVGTDIIRPLVLKVISILEMLESSVRKIELMQLELQEIQACNSHLLSFKSVKDHDTDKLKQTLEEVETSWVQEITTLEAQVSSLQIENEQLRSNLTRNKESSLESNGLCEKIIQEQEEVIHKLKHSLRQKDTQLMDCDRSISDLNCKMNELLQMNKILHVQSQEILKIITKKNSGYKDEAISQLKENPFIAENVSKLVQCNNQKDAAYNCKCYSCEELMRTDIAQSIWSDTKFLEKMKSLQSELHFQRCLSYQYEEDLLKWREDKSKHCLLSKFKIYQFFHFFLGVYYFAWRYFF